MTQKLKPLFSQPKNTLPNAAENVADFQKIVAKFWDFVIAKEPSLRDYFNKGDVAPEAEREKNKNLFFRPVGLELLSRIYTQCCKDGQLDKLANALSDWQFNNPKGVWDGVIWKNGKIDASGPSAQRRIPVVSLLYERTRIRYLETARIIARRSQFSHL